MAAKQLTYSGIHRWVYRHKGNAKLYRCSFQDETCKGQVEWASISRTYQKDLSDWKTLCRSHHRRFDMTDEWRANLSKAHLGKEPSNKQFIYIKCPRCGNKNRRSLSTVKRLYCDRECFYGPRHNHLTDHEVDLMRTLANKYDKTKNKT